RIRRDQALAKIAAAFGEDGEITALLPAAWERARSDEALGLALAWIREQLRASLEDILEAGVRVGAIRKDPPPAVLAWVLLAGCSVPGSRSIRWSPKRSWTSEMAALTWSMVQPSTSV